MADSEGNGKNGPRLPVTDPVPRAGDFPLGSIESRAAARASLDQAENDPSRYLVARIIDAATGRVEEEIRVEVTEEFRKKFGGIP